MGGTPRVPYARPGTARLAGWAFVPTLLYPPPMTSTLHAPATFETMHAALAPALRPYLEVGRDGWPMLRSPWVYEFARVDVERANARYAWVAPRLSAAILTGDYVEGLRLVERPYQLQVLYAWWQAFSLTPAELRPLLADVLPGVEFLHEDQAAVLELLRAAGRVTDRDRRSMDDTADAADDATDGRAPHVLLLPATGAITIYRGATDPQHVGMAWTLDREQACWFARRFGIGTPTLFTTQVRAERVYAAFVRESTILVDPKSIRRLRREPI